MNKFFIYVSVLAFTLSCNDDAKTIIEDVQDVELLENNILKFKDQATFDKYVAQESNAPEGFYSIYQRFDEAMSEAESYYPREGGYFEFKEKYRELYFPEQGTDYSAYLPVSNEAKAKFLNLNCEVMIGDELKNFKDVDTYAKLQAIGKAVPEAVQRTAFEPEGTVDTRTNYYDTNGMYKIYSSGNGRVIWVNLHWKYYPAPYYESYLQAEICFRKREKVFLLGWVDYNYNAGTSFYFNGNLFQSRTGFSSHNYEYLKVATFINGTKWWHSGTGSHQISFTHSSWAGDKFYINVNLPAGQINDWILGNFDF